MMIVSMIMTVIERVTKN